MASKSVEKVADATLSAGETVEKSAGTPIKKAPSKKSKVSASENGKKVEKKKVEKPVKSESSETARQIGPLALPFEALSRNEVKVVEVLRRSKEPLELKVLAKETFPRLTKAHANSWVRNALRRLVRANFVERVARGSYQATTKV